MYAESIYEPCSQFLVAFDHQLKAVLIYDKGNSKKDLDKSLSSTSWIQMMDCERVRIDLTSDELRFTKEVQEDLSLFIQQQPPSDLYACLKGDPKNLITNLKILAQEKV